MSETMDPTELMITLGVLALELVIFGLCYLRVKQPPNPMKPRLIPYNLIMLLLVVGIFVTLAHTVGVITGHKIEGRTRMKGQSL